MSVARKDCRLSSGPVQPDNLPYRHGLCAATIIPEPQKRNEVTAFDAQMMRELDLRSPLQQAVAERAVMMAWKLRHVREVEAELVDQEFAALRDSYPDDYKTPASVEVWHLVNEGGKNCRVNPFSTLRRYESSIERSFYRSIRDLKHLQEQSQFEDIEEEPVEEPLPDPQEQHQPPEQQSEAPAEEAEPAEPVATEQSRSSRAAQSRKPKKDCRLEFMEQVDEVEKKLLERIQMGRITDGLRLDLPEEMMKNRSRR